MDSIAASLSSLVGIFQFSSGPYLVLLAFSVIGYFLLPGPRTRAVWLLLVSSGFYLTLSPGSFVVLLCVAALSYLTGYILDVPETAEESRAWNSRRIILVISLVLMVGALVVFKYLGFLGTISNAVLGIAGLSASLPIIRLALPLGISFWTFQAIAYVVDVYKRRTPAVENPLYFLVSVAYFPIVTAGPITRVQRLVEQLSEKHRFSYPDMQSGLLLIGRGFFMKLMVADRLAVFVNKVFSNPTAYPGKTSGSILLVAAIFFSIQLYFDFSGYTDIVRGSSRLFGVELPINFRAPYFSRSVREFWRRWHMTLMDWFREYIYIPLGGNRRGNVRRYVNLTIVFGLSGLWHGAGLTYLVWGLLNGAYVIADEAFEPLRDRIVRVLRIDRATVGHKIVQTMMTFVLIHDRLGVLPRQLDG